MINSTEILTFNPNPKTAKEAIEQCAMANRILANENIIDVYGHISVRNPENPNTFFQADRKTPEIITRNDILEFDLDGNIVSSNKGTCNRELPMHIAIYKTREDVNAVCHCHLKELEPFACTGTPIRPLAHPMGIFYDGIPTYVAEDSSPGFHFTTSEKCHNLVNTLKNHRAILLRHRGAVIVGENLINMIIASLSLRDCAILQFQAMSLGEPVFMSEKESKEVCKLTLSYETGERMWNHLVKRMIKNMPDLYW